MRIQFTHYTASLITAITFFTPCQLFGHAGHKHEAEDPSISLPRVVAKVNGVNIQRSKVLVRLKGVLRRFIIQGQRPSIIQEKAEAKKLIGEEISNELVRQKAKELKISVSQAEMDEKIHLIMGRFDSSDDFYKRLAKIGLTLDRYKDELRPGLLMDMLIEKEMASKLLVEPEEVKSYFDKNKNSFWKEPQARARVILVKIEYSQGPKADQMAQREINKIYQESKSGADFAELAKKYSQDSLAKKGGDLGYFTESKMLKAFSERAFQTKVGSVTKPFLTKLGWHILKTIDKKPGSYQSFEKVEEKIKKTLKGIKTTKSTRMYIKSLKEKADIQIYY